MSLFKELWEAGFFQALFRFKNPVLSALILGSVLLGAVVQVVLLRRTERGRFVFAAVLTAAAFLFWCLYQTESGWDTLGYMLLFGFSLTTLLGTALGALIYVFTVRRRS